MGNTYTRQSSATIIDGGTIEASDFNNEFDNILAAFNSSTGHVHNGTDAARIQLFGQAGELVGDTANVIKPYQDDTVDLGTSSVKFKDLYIDGIAYLDGINYNGTAITSTAAELNILDGVTSTATELNLVDGSTAGTIVNSKAVIYGASGEVNATTLQIGGTAITSTPAELNLLDGVTATTTELNILDGVTATATELNLLDGVTATTTELNILDGVTATTAELNLLDGATTATSTTIADADRVIVNDNGTMVQVAVTDLDTYFAQTTQTLTNKTLTSPSISKIESLALSSSDMHLEANRHILLDVGSSGSGTNKIKLVDNNIEYGAIFKNGSSIQINDSTSTRALTLSSSGAVFEAGVTISGNLVNSSSTGEIQNEGEVTLGTNSGLFNLIGGLADTSTLWLRGCPVAVNGRPDVAGFDESITSTSNVTNIGSDGARYLKHTLSENTTLTKNGWYGSTSNVNVDVYEFWLEIAQPSGQSYTLSWDSNFKFAGGTAYTAPSSNTSDIYHILAINGQGRTRQFLVNRFAQNIS